LHHMPTAHVQTYVKHDHTQAGWLKLSRTRALRASVGGGMNAARRKTRNRSWRCSPSAAYDFARVVRDVFTTIPVLGADGSM